MMDKTKVTKDLDKKLLTLERTLDAPKAKLWQAFSDKDWFVKWWGPEGWETTVKEFDFKSGGRNHYAMKCVDESQGEWFGQESWGLMEYESIKEPDSFSYKDYFANEDGTTQSGMPVTAITVELVEADGKTNMITHCHGETAEEIEKLMEMGMVEGFSSSMNKLEKLMAE
jgi:uncharacterized protein YndB with AHSA1/START domain